MTALTQTASFWDRLAERYAAQPVKDPKSYEITLDRVRAHLKPADRVLEIGCGTGTTALKLADAAAEITATDVSGKMIEIAQRKADAANVSNVSFEVAEVDAIEARAASLDAVLALSLIHLLEDRDRAIARVFELLKPGGIFVSSTVCLGDSMKWFRFVGPIGRALGLMPYVSVFSVHELEQSIRRAGFDIEIQWQPGDGRTVFIIARKPGQ